MGMGEDSFILVVSRKGPIEKDLLKARTKEEGRILGCYWV